MKPDSLECLIFRTRNGQWKTRYRLSASDAWRFTRPTDTVAEQLAKLLLCVEESFDE